MAGTINISLSVSTKFIIYNYSNLNYDTDKRAHMYNVYKYIRSYRARVLYFRGKPGVGQVYSFGPRQYK